MLNMLFLICAVVGGALVLAQLILSAVAFGAGHGLHLHHHLGSAAAHRGSLHRGVHHSRAGIRTNASRGVRAARGGAGKQTFKTTTARKSSAWAASGHWAMAWLLGMFNFQSIVAGVTVFGLVGLAANAAKEPAYFCLKLGIAAALVMMALISDILTLMVRMEKDGTADLQQAVGKSATIYLSVPPKNEGQGKVTVSLQQQLMEFPAVTFQDDPLLAGQKVVIVSVLGTSTMLVVSADKYAQEAAV